MAKKIIWTCIAIVVIVLIIISTNGPEISGTTNEPIRIGASTSLTGVASDFGEMSKKGMELAVEEINERGGIKGRKIELYIEDDKTTPAGALSAYQKLIGVNKVEAIIGGLFDFTAQPIFPLAARDKVTFISPINFVIDGTFEMNDHTFVMYPRFDQVVFELKTVIAGRNINTLGMLRFQSGFSESIQHTLESIMSELGRKPLITETYLAIGSSDFRTNILKLKDKQLDAIFLDMLDFDIVKYITDAKNLGFKKQIISYTSIRDVLDNKKVSATDLEGTIMLDWEVSSKEFSDLFFKRYGVLPRRGANKSYDAVYVLAEAIANTKDKSEVATYIERTDFKTVNGSFKFTKEHAVKTSPVKVYEVKDGGFVEIKSN